MSFFNSLLGNASSKEDIQKKCLEAIMHYRNRDFVNAVRSFEQYFEMKGQGRFPEFDSEDAGMLLNLGNAKQYSVDLKGAILIYEKLIESAPTWNAPYLMNSICHYKIGNATKAKLNWELAKKFGNKMAQETFETGILKF